MCSRKVRVKDRMSESSSTSRIVICESPDGSRSSSLGAAKSTLVGAKLTLVGAEARLGAAEARPAANTSRETSGSLSEGISRSFAGFDGCIGIACLCWNCVKRCVTAPSGAKLQTSTAPAGEWVQGRVGSRSSGFKGISSKHRARRPRRQSFAAPVVRGASHMDSGSRIGVAWDSPRQPHKSAPLPPLLISLRRKGDLLAQKGGKKAIKRRRRFAQYGLSPRLRYW